MLPTKRTLCTFTSVFLMLVSCTLSLQASDTKIDSVTITGIPVIEPESAIADAQFTVDTPVGCIVETQWMKWDTAEMMYLPVEDGIFEPDAVYYSTIQVSAEDGYEFSDSFSFSFADGIEEGIWWYEEDENGSITYYCEMNVITFTTRIYRIDITTPDVIAGNTASVEEIVIYSGDLIVPNENMEITTQWFCTTDNYTDITGNAFIDEEAYQLQITFDAGTDYSFANELEVFINGEYIFAFADPKHLEIFQDYSLMPPIEQIELAGLPKGVAGEELTDALEILSEVENCDVYMTWLDGDANEITDEAFRAGETYYLYIEVYLYGNEPISDNFTFLIDGIEYTPTVIWTEYNQAYLELEYTIEEGSDTSLTEASVSSESTPASMILFWSVFTVWNLFTTFMN